MRSRYKSELNVHSANQTTNWKRSDSDRFILSFDLKSDEIYNGFTRVYVPLAEHATHKTTLCFIHTCGEHWSCYKLGNSHALLPLRVHNLLFQAASLAVHQLLDPAGKGLAQALDIEVVVHIGTAQTQPSTECCWSLLPTPGRKCPLQAMAQPGHSGLTRPQRSRSSPVGVSYDLMLPFGPLWGRSQRGPNALTEVFRTI